MNRSLGEELRCLARVSVPLKPRAVAHVIKLAVGVVLEITDLFE